MLSDLPDGTWFNYDADDPTSVDEADEHWRTMSVHPEPVIIVLWADGSTPQAPTVDSGELGPWCCYADEVGVYAEGVCTADDPRHAPTHCGYDNVRRGLVPAPTVDSDELRRADGAGLIAAERQRQIDAENWTPEHDDTHTIGELVDAAVCYLRHGLDAEMAVVWPWPWTEDWWKPSDDPIKNLVRAGALIAAEIDRLTRAAAGVSSDR